MTIKLNSFGGGVFVSRFFSTKTVVAAGVATMFTLTPPAGQRVKINNISASGVDITDLDLTVGGVSYFTGVTVADTPDVNGELVVASNGAIVVNASAGILPYILGGVDEVIELIKTANAQGANIHYSYEFGELG